MEESMSMFIIISLALVGLLVFLTFLGSFFTVRSQTSAIVERFGKFSNVASEGLNFKIPFIDNVVDYVDLSVQQLVVKVETKTMDNVFVTTAVSIQYNVIKDKVKEAYYKLSDPSKQIESYVFDVVRSEIPKMKLDDVFINKDSIAQAVKEDLEDSMDDFGFQIIRTLITDIDPDQKVKNSMNEINAATRLREAANEKAEADKIMLIKQAEAEAESKRLQGLGLAQQRKEIAKGLKESIDELKATGLDNEQVTSLLLINQHYDSITHIAKHSQNNTILVPYSMNQVSDIKTQLQEASLISATIPKSKGSV